MTERPIIFSRPMVRAILDRRKTQTRRVVKPQPFRDGDDGALIWKQGRLLNACHCPYGQPGDRLWVRETWAPISPDENRRPWRECNIEFRADTDASHPGGWDNAPDDADAAKWKPSIHMPRWASRITLEVTGVRVERLQEITEDDARAEGVDAVTMADVPRQATWSARQDFAQLWDKINAKRAPWESNPWVWVVEFKRC